MINILANFGDIGIFWKLKKKYLIGSLKKQKY